MLHQRDDGLRCDACDMHIADMQESETVRVWVECSVPIYIAADDLRVRRVVALGAVHGRPCCHTSDMERPTHFGAKDTVIKVWSADTGYVLDGDDWFDSEAEILDYLRDVYGLGARDKSRNMRALDQSLLMRRAGAFRPTPTDKPEVRP